MVTLSSARLDSLLGALNAPSIVVLCVVGALTAAAILFLVLSRRKGKSSCCGDCSCCQYRCDRERDE